MRRLVRLLLGIAVVTALLGGVSLTEPLAAPAGAATYISKRYTAPKRGDSGPGVVALQRRLDQANVLSSKYVTGFFGPKTTNAVQRFQRKVGLARTGKVTGKTWRKLVRKTGSIKLSASAGQRHIDSRCKVKGRVLCIDKTRDKLYYMKNSKIIKTFDARFGCARTRTREGRFRIHRKSRNHYSTLYHTPMPYAMFFSGGQAVHYSADFAARGYNGCSHGCVNTRNRSGIRWVFNRVRVGDRVIIYRS